MKIEIPEQHLQTIKELLDEILEFYEDDNWLVVKKYILRYSHPDVRKHFSTRDHKTKKHMLNDFEKQLIIYCNHIYGVQLVLNREDRHHEKEHTKD